ncbi:hypothetical protein STEG23_020042 [Scotinomys teguina]
MFITTIEETSPWFLTGGGFNIADWEQVKRDLQKALRERGPDNLLIATFSLWRLVKDALLTDRVKVKEQLAELEKEEQERETVASLQEEEREADKNLARSGDLEESDSAVGEVKDLDLEDEEERLESEKREET